MAWFRCIWPRHPVGRRAGKVSPPSEYPSLRVPTPKTPPGVGKCMSYTVPFWSSIPAVKVFPKTASSFQKETGG
jgi:hypothetical protein